MSRKNWISLLRWVIIAYFLVFYIILGGRPIIENLPFLLLILFVSTYNLFINLVPIERWKENRKKMFSYIILIFDVSAVTAVVYLIKAPRTPLFILYIFVIFGAGYAYSLKGALSATILSILFYLGIEIDKLPPLTIQEVISSVLFSQILFLLTVGIIVALISNELTKHQKEKELYGYLSLISQKLSSAFSIDKILDLVIDFASLLKLETVLLMLLDEETDEFYISSYKGISDDLIKDLRISKKLPEIARMVTSKKPLVVSDTTKTTISKALVLQKDIRAFIDFPSIASDKVIGILSLSSTKPHKFRTHEIQILQTLSSQAAIAIERVKLYEEMERERKELAVLNKITQEINSILSFDELLKYVVEVTCKLLNVEVCSLMLLDDNNKLVIKEAKGLPIDIIKYTRLKLGEGIQGKVVESGKPYLVKDTKELEKDKMAIPLCVPLIVNKKPIGVINVNNKKDGGMFNKDDLRLLITLANQISATIERAKLYDNLETSYLSTIGSLIGSFDEKDGYEHTHSQEVASYSVKIAQKLNLSKEEINDVSRAALLCDLGKIAIKERILHKKKTLTEKELEIIEEHPEISANILKETKFLQDIIPIILHHHERYDGTGYPDGLKGNEIPLGARIIAVADAYYAMLSNRPYRRALTKQEAIRELKRNINRQFDPKVVKAFLEILEEEE